jgi:hypothetical protein
LHLAVHQLTEERLTTRKTGNELGNVMASAVTFEQVETLAKQLLPEDQLRLVARITDRLSKQPPIQPQTSVENRRTEYAAQLEAFLKMSDENAAACCGEVDSADDIRRIREERASRL